MCPMSPHGPLYSVPTVGILHNQVLRNLVAIEIREQGGVIAVSAKLANKANHIHYAHSAVILTALSQRALSTAPGPQHHL